MNVQIKLISCLLHYPDESLIRWLPEFKQVLNEIESVTARNRYDKILFYFEQTPLIVLQEQYTETFDLNPSNCMNLTYHRWGDTEKRGPALAHLEDIYLKSGFERISGELPDFLPLILEFISERPEVANSEIIPVYGTVVGTLAERLGQAGHPYAPLFEQLIDIFGLSDTADNSQAKAMN
jgi:nitrate reductase molybdenum cofactor assembly chaperone NarJ/NarW